MKDTIFTMRCTPYKFGVGATEEIGSDVASLGLKRVLIVTDPGVAATGLTNRVMDRIRASGIETDLYANVNIEPTDTSVKAAIDYATSFNGDGYVAIGGGSVMDTAKIMNLYVTYPAPFLAYVNAPIGEARPVPGPLKPMVCLPTTAGTSSENTAIAVVDMTELRVKTGISHHYLRATLGILERIVRVGMPPGLRP